MNVTKVIPGFFIMRIFGAFAVVAIHVAYPITSNFSLFGQTEWLVAHSWEAFFRSGVAIFLMLTGALLLESTVHSKSFFRKRVVRILPPFIFWSLVYFLVQQPSLDLTMGETILMFITGTAPHLWYVKTVLLLYFLIAIIKNKIVHASNLSIISLLIIIEAFVLISLLYRQSVFFNEVRSFLSCFQFLILGYYLYRIKLTKAYRKTVGLLLFIFGALCAFFGTYSYSKYANEYKDIFYSLLSPFIVLKAAGTFLLFPVKRIKIEEAMLSGIKKVAETTFGVYLVHPLILTYIVYPLGFSEITVIPLIGIPLTAGVCFLLSVGFMYLISLSKISRYLM